MTRNRSIQEIHFCLSWCIVVAGILGSWRSNVQAATLEEMLPTSVNGAFVSSNLASTCKAWQVTQIGQLLAGDAFLPLRKTVETRNIPTLLHLRPWFGFDWSELSAWEGPAALIVFPVSDQETGTAWVFLGDMEHLKHSPWIDGEEYFRKKGYRKSTEAIGEAKLLVFSNPAADRSSRRPAYLLAKSTFIAADSAATAKSFWQGMNRKDNLAASADYRTIVADMKSAKEESSEIHWWVRPLELWANLRSEQPSASDRDWLAVARRQGGSAIVAAAGRISFPASGETEIDVQGNLLLKRPLTKAARLLEFRTSSRRLLPDWLGENVTSVAFWGWDCPQAIKAFGNYFDDLNEPGPKGEGLFEEMLSALHDDPEGPQVDLAKDLFPQLGPAVCQAVEEKGQTASTERRSRRSLFVFECRDVAKVEKTLTKFYADDKDVIRAKRGNEQLWTIGPGRSLFVESTSSTVGNVRAVLLGSKELLVATEPEMIPQQQASAPLSKNAAYQAFLQWLQRNDADRAVFCGFLQTSIWLEGSYVNVRNHAKGTESDWTAEVLRFALTGSRNPSPDFPVDELPSYETVRPHLAAFAEMLRDNSTGLEIRGGVLRKNASASQEQK